MSNVFFSVSFSEMGINNLTMFVIVLFSFIFFIGFIYSSKNMDGEGVMKWMMKKPKDWVGYKDQK